MSEVKERKYLTVEGVELLRQAQSGNRVAQDDLILLIKTQFMARRIGRYIGRNRQVDNEDIRQEFLIGVAQGIPSARLDIGDPIEFIIRSGVWRVQGYMRKHIRQGTMQVCSTCGHKGRLNKVGMKYECKNCGSIEVETYEVDDHNEIALESITDNGFEDELTSSLLFTRFEETLTPGTNIHNLYVLLKSGIDRDNPAVKNYIKEIAKMWGGCSDQNVVRTLEKLRDRMRKFIIDNQIECYTALIS